MDAFVGIDVGKRMLEVAIVGDPVIHRVPNTLDGWRRVITLLAGRTQPGIVLEATNRYHEGVVAMLAANGTPATIANPHHTAAFRRSEGHLAKTDRIDARMLARFAEQKRPAPTPLRSPARQDLRDLERARTDLVEARVRTQHQARDLPAPVAAVYAPVLAALEAQITALDRALADRIAADPELAHTDALLRSMPGLGATLSACLLANLPELGSLDRRRIASLGGLAPRNQESGQWSGRPAVWGGRRVIRHASYLLALGAVQTRSSGRVATGADVIEARYLALQARGKPKQLALLAIARWLLTILNVMVRDGLTWPETRAFQGGVPR